MSVDDAIALDPILTLPEGLERTAALAAWFQGLYPPAAGAPILVGGAAVEILSGGAYTTGDLDFVGEVPPEVVRRLEAAGFSRHGRHWMHEEGQVFLEVRGAGLEPDERAIFTQVAGWTVLILSPEDVPSGIGVWPLQRLRAASPGFRVLHRLSSGLGEKGSR